MARSFERVYSWNVQKPQFSEVGLAILAGGEGSRMGQPKGLLKIGGKPILQYLFDRIAWPGPNWLVTAPGREHPPGWESFEQEWVDPVAGQGPLRGVLTALENATTPVIVILTLDMPGIGKEQVEWIAGRMLTGSQLGVMGRTAQGVIEPFPLGIRIETAPMIRRRIDGGRLSVNGLLEERGFMAPEVPIEWGSQTWVNLNRPEDLKQCQN